MESKNSRCAENFAHGGKQKPSTGLGWVGFLQIGGRRSTGQTARQVVVVRCWALACLSLQWEHGAGVQAACIHVAVVNQALHVVLHLLHGLAEVLGNLLHAVNGLALLIHVCGLG